MQRELQRIAAEEYDLLIIGGGINGLAAAWDAALRGLKVALVEKGDYGAQTSSATLKIVHGGLRYLQHLDIVRSRESIRERSVMLAIAPHLVQPFPFVVPTYGHLLQGREFMSIGILLNEIVSFDRNRAIKDPGRRIPAGRILSRAECLQLVPRVNEKGLTGGVMFYDAQMYNSDRLTLSFALSAAEKGVDLANYVEAVQLLHKDKRVTGARVKDLLTGSEFDVRAKLVANMTGPWSDIVLGLMGAEKPGRRVVRSKGIQIVTPPLTDSCGLAVQSKYRDPDAVFNRGGRNYFIMPWRGRSLIGTTDTVYEGDPDDFRITGKDISDFLAEINEAVPSAGFLREDVTFAFGGLRPITEKNIDTGSTVARKYEVYDHARDLGVEGLITVIGVKYTTCRFLAEKVVNLVFKKTGRASPPVVTDRTALAGGNIENFEAFERELIARPPAPLSQKTLVHLAHNYGTRYPVVTDRIRGDAALGTLVDGSEEVTRAEVLHAVREESAVHLADVVLRRTDLGTLGHPGRAALEECATIMARELGWDTVRTAREVEEAERCFVFG